MVSLKVRALNGTTEVSELWGKGAWLENASVISKKFLSLPGNFLITRVTKGLSVAVICSKIKIEDLTPFLKKFINSQTYEGRQRIYGCNCSQFKENEIVKYALL